MSHPRVKENVGSWSGCGKHGTGNVLRENCIWPPTFQKAGEGFTLVNNFYVEPAYVNAAAKDFRIVPGTPCAPLVDRSRLRAPGGGPGKRAGAALVLQSSRRWVRIGGPLRAVGQPRGRRAAPACAHPGAPRQPLAPRAQRTAGPQGPLPRRRAAATRRGHRHGSRLGAARLPRNARALRLRAHVPGVGSSAAVRVRIRR